MPYSIEYENTLGLIKTKVTGKIQADITRMLVAEAITLGRSNQCHAYLFDIREAAVLDKGFKAFEFMAGLDSLGFSETEDRVAIVFSSRAEVYHFSETVARNTGWPFICYFFDPEKAEEWLVNESNR
jgi:hypothetical protein